MGEWCRSSPTFAATAKPPRSSLKCSKFQIAAHVVTPTIPAVIVEDDSAADTSALLEEAARGRAHHARPPRPLSTSPQTSLTAFAQKNLSHTDQVY